VKQLFIEDAKPGQVAGGFMYVESMRDLDTDRLVAGNWRPATRWERLRFEFRRPRFSYRYLLIWVVILWLLLRLAEWLAS